MVGVIEQLPRGRLMSLAEVADRCCAAYVVARSWVTEGVEIFGKKVKLRAVRVGHDGWRVDPDDLVKFLRACNPEYNPGEGV